MRAWILLVAVCTCLLTGCGAGPTASRPPGRFDSYVAIGDSYTAAPGTGAHVGPIVCGRSGRNYPRLIAVALHLALFQRSEEQRLNSSHPSISYAVFCLKKKTKRLTQ